MKVKEFFTDSSKWTQGASFRDPCGDILPNNPPSNGADFKACLAGAIRFCYRDQTKINKVYRKVSSHLALIDPVTWNDHSSRKFEEVKELVEKLDI